MNKRPNVTTTLYNPSGGHRTAADRAAVGLTVEHSSQTREPRIADTFIGIVLAVLAASNLVQGAWISTVPWLDITTISFVLAPIIAYAGIRQKVSLHGVLAILLLLVPISLGFLQGPAGPDAADKRVKIAIGVVLVLVAAFLSLNTARRIRIFFSTITVLALVAIVAQGLNPDTAALITGRRTPEGLNAIGLARLLGAALVVVLSLTSRELTMKRACTVVALGTPLVAGLLLAGSRGPLLGTAAGILALLLMHPRLKSKTKATILAVGVPALYSVYRLLSSASLRVVDLGSTGRELLYNIGIHTAISNPTGVGWGNFYRYVPSSLLNLGQGEDIYVHNIVLEFLVESGMIGAVCFLGFVIITGVIGMRTARTSHEGLSLFALGTTLFVGALLSSDIVGNRMFWVVCGAILAHAVVISYRERPRGSTAARRQ